MVKIANSKLLKCMLEIFAGYGLQKSKYTFQNKQTIQLVRGAGERSKVTRISFSCSGSKTGARPSGTAPFFFDFFLNFSQNTFSIRFANSEFILIDVIYD